jgi:alcohol dehydrogenase class IV
LFQSGAAREDEHACCSAFAEELAALSVRLGPPQRLREVGIASADLPTLAADAMKQRRLLVNNPRVVKEEDALAIYQAAF